MVIKSKGIVQVILLIFIGILISLNYVSAITGRIGNGIMILNAEVGDVINKSVLVINDNNVTVNITVSASEGLEKDVNIIDKNFILQPGEEKKAQFTISIKQPGTTTTRINIQFSPITNSSKSGVGMSSQVTIHAYGQGELPKENNTDSGNVNGNVNSSVNGNPITGSTVNGENSPNNNILIIMSVMSLVLLIVLVFLIGFLSKSKSTKSKIDEINQEETDSKKKTNKEEVK